VQESYKVPYGRWSLGGGDVTAVIGDVRIENTAKRMEKEEQE
jgi:hypothetical protein